MPSPVGLVEDPITDLERLEVAGRCRDDLELPMPILVDRVDDKVSRTYGAWPDRLFVIGKDGKVAYAGAQGPRGFDPEAWATAIERARQDAAPKDGKPAGPPAPAPTPKK
jgi:type I thyroxine 5'-deiodinase